MQLKDLLVQSWGDRILQKVRAGYKYFGYNLKQAHKKIKCSSNKYRISMVPKASVGAAEGSDLVVNLNIQGNDIVNDKKLMYRINQAVNRLKSAFR